jgi:hypothetical protein
MKRTLAVAAFALAISASLFALVGAQVTCATAGTATRLAQVSTKCTAYNVYALPANSGYIYVGGSNVSSSVYAIRLSAGDNYAWSAAGNTYPYDLFTIYFTSSVNGEGVAYGCQ